MWRRAALTIFLAFGLTAFALAQEDNVDANKGSGLMVTLDMSVDAFNFKYWDYGSSEIRGRVEQNHSELQYLISNWNFAKDAQASIEYNDSFFGGKFIFQPQIAGGSWTFGAKMKGWAQFSFLRATLGNDIETNYADWQGSENSLRIYNGTEFENPDNITNSSGLLVEAFLNPFTFAVAAGDFLTKWKNTDRIKNGAADDNIYKDTYDTKLTYGARIGYDLAGLGKINASYKISYNANGDSFRVPGGDFPELEPYFADAEVFRHVFGLYGSFYFGNLGFTAAYLGHATIYLSEYFNSQSTIRNMVETAVPVIYKNGLALNAQWKAPGGLDVRTENSVTLWRDKDYNNFGTSRARWNLNTERKEDAEAYAFIDYLALQNGIGFGYLFTNKLEGKIFFQNTLLRTSAEGLSPIGEQVKYVLTQDTVRVELGLNYHFNPNAMVFIKLDIADTITSRSRDLTAAIPNYFLDSVHNEKPQPIATIDNAFVIRIPIGITLKIQ